MAEKRSITVTVNGSEHRMQAEPRRSLLDFLRIDLGLTGTHAGCEHGVCGACTVLLDGQTVRSCLLFAVQADGKNLTTIEGLASNDAAKVLQEKFSKHHALQCGFCTPGMLLAAFEMLQADEPLTDAEIRSGLAGNLCMCTGYENIVRAVGAAAKARRSGEEERA